MEQAEFMHDKNERLFRQACGELEKLNDPQAKLQLLDCLTTFYNIQRRRIDRLFNTPEIYEGTTAAEPSHSKNAAA